MIFLNTDNSMKIIDTDELYSTYYIDIDDSMLDLDVPSFTNKIAEKVHHYNYAKDTPVLFIVRCNDISEADIEYSKNLICEVITESIRYEKVNKNWQPSIPLSKRLDMTIRSQNNLLNYNTIPNILNIKFAKDEKILYNIVRENEKKEK